MGKVRGFLHLEAIKKNRPVSVSLLKDIARAAEADLEKDEEEEYVGEGEEEENEGNEGEIETSREIEYRNEDFEVSSGDDLPHEAELHRDSEKEEKKFGDREAYSPMDKQDYNTSSEFSEKKENEVDNEENKDSRKNKDLRPEEIDSEEDIDIDNC